MSSLRFVVSADQAGERLDRCLRRMLPGASRMLVAELVEQGKVRVNGRRTSKGALLASGDAVEVHEPPGAAVAAPDPELPLRVLYEDAVLVVVDKPAGLPSHPLRPGERRTLAGALLARYPEMAGVGHRALEPGIVHRLDTDTSGVLLAAREARAFEALRRAHERGEIDKRYLALCAGAVTAPARARGYLAADRRKVRVQAEPFARAKPVETELSPAELLRGFSLVSVRVSFAARHQVRAQLAALGHPIAGDALYGGPALEGLHRHFLHASEVALRHPITGEVLELRAPLPAELEGVLGALRGGAPSTP